MYLEVLLIIVLFVKIYQWATQKYEHFDNNCIYNIRPSFSLKLSDSFKRDASNNLKYDDKGNIEINYANMDIMSNYNKDMIENGKNDLQILLSNPFGELNENKLLNYQSCKLSYLE